MFSASFTAGKYRGKMVFWQAVHLSWITAVPNGGVPKNIVLFLSGRSPSDGGGGLFIFS
jgi:hypothetical protein